MDCGHTADIQTTWGRSCNGQGCSCPLLPSCVDLNTSVQFLRSSSGSYWDMLAGSPSLRSKLWRNGDQTRLSRTTSRTLPSYGPFPSLKENNAYLQHDKLMKAYVNVWCRHLSKKNICPQFQYTYYFVILKNFQEIYLSIYLSFFFHWFNYPVV